MSNDHHAPVQCIEVLPHDPAWASDYEQSSEAIRRALGANLVELHHIGSTAIPSIQAKPIIDMLAVVVDLSALDSQGSQMESLGYEAMGAFGITGRRYFRKEDLEGRRTHQVHAFVLGSPHVSRHLAFRDYLRAHRSEAQAYSLLKRGLAEAHPHDMDAYIAGKDGWIKETESRALRWWPGQNHGRSD